jgi:site-specific recombinase XerD
MTAKPKDAFLRLLREWFTVFLPRQRAASPNTIESARRTWNMLLRHIAETRHVNAEAITFAMLDRAAVAGFLDHMKTKKRWTAATYNQRLACIRSFFKYVATAEPILACHLADLAGIPPMRGPASKPVAHMSQTAVTALLAQPDPTTRAGLRDQFFMILMYDTAARDAEMLAMDVGDLDPKRLTVDLLGKGRKPRRIPITRETEVDPLTRTLWLVGFGFLEQPTLIG